MQGEEVHVDAERTRLADNRATFEPTVSCCHRAKTTRRGPATCSPNPAWASATSPETLNVAPYSGKRRLRVFGVPLEAATYNKERHTIADIFPAFCGSQNGTLGA
jgi:hypothetical protein